jgi:hypothetical protein
VSVGTTGAAPVSTLNPPAIVTPENSIILFLYLREVKKNSVLPLLFSMSQIN